MSPKQKSLTPRQIKKREKVLQTVLFYIEKKGYDGVSMRKVAQKAGVSPSTLYEIYGSKEDLILATIGDRIRNLPAEEDKYEPGLNRLLNRLWTIADLFERSPDSSEALAKLLFHGNADSPAKELLLDHAVEARKTSLLEMIEMEQLTKDFDVDFYARLLISITWGTALLWLKGLITYEKFREELILGSMTTLLPVATPKGRKQLLKIIAAPTVSPR